MLRKLYLSAVSLYLFSACALLDTMVATPEGEVRVGDALASGVESYGPAVTDALGGAVSAASGNPVLGGALAAALLGAGGFAAKKLRKSPKSPPTA